MRTDYEMNMKNKRKGSNKKYEEQLLLQNQSNLSLKVNAIKSKLNELQKNLLDSLQMIQIGNQNYTYKTSNQRDSVIKINQEQKEQLINKLQDSPALQQKQIHGPQILLHSPIEKTGDDHPEEDDSNDEPYYNKSKNEMFDFNFQNDIVRKLKQVLSISQSIRNACSQKESVNKSEDSPTLKNISTSLLQFPQSYSNISVLSSPGKRKNYRQMTQKAAAEQRVKQALKKKTSYNNQDQSPNQFQNQLNSKSNEQSPSYHESLPFSQPDSVRKNLSIYFGHQNWNLVLNMMIGIRQAIVDLYPTEYDKELQDVYYNEQKMYDLFSKKNSGYDMRDSCKFYDYAPKIFQRIRQLYGIQDEQYRRSIGPEALLGNLIMGNLSNLTEKCSSGKSGSFFYYSYDDQYMLKTISKEEFVFFRKILKPYYLHLNKYRDSLAMRIYGLHHMEVYISKNKYKDIFFCVMGNLFRWDRDICYRYDLKGSTYGRTSRSSKHQIIDKSIALKDKDWIEDNKLINVNPAYLRYLKKQIEIDTQFFIENEIIDYSLLIGFSDVTDQELLIYFIKYIDREEDQQNNDVLQDAQNQEYLRAYEVINIFYYGY